jgi:hypothetical protein
MCIEPKPSIERIAPMAKAQPRMVMMECKNLMALQLPLRNRD